MKGLEILLHSFIGISSLCGHFMYNKRHLLHFQKSKVVDKDLTVSIIIPARDEAKRLPKLLKSIAQQSIKVEVIVMDDGSKDNTVEVANEFGACVYRVGENTDNKRWYGKSYACYEGVKHATSKTIIFIDADVVLMNEHVLEAIMQTYAQQSYRGLLSVQPYHIVQRPYEQASALFNLMTVVGMNQSSTLANSQTQSLAFGPVTVMNQTDYALTEGHKSAQTHIIEGFALGQAFQQHHLPVTAYEGQGHIGFRMYEEGPKSLVEGWTKHLAVGASATQGHIMAMIIIWMIGTMTSNLALILGLVVKSLSFKRICVSYGIYTIQFVKLHKRVGSFSLLFLILNPLLFWIFILIFMNSYRHIYFTKTVKWKGRTFNIND